MAKIKTADEIKKLRVGGKRLSRVLDALEELVIPGITTKEIDMLGERLIREGGDVPAFLNYQPDGASFPYPATVCISVNDEVVHGIPGERMLKAGDIVSLDIGLVHEGMVLDMARTLPVGDVGADVEKLLETTKEALKAGIKAAVAGNRIGDISAAIEAVGKKGGFGIVRELGGHGVGHHVHELPYVPNYGKAGTGPVIEVGMILALEPMLNLGGDDVYLDKDGYTYITEDHKKSAHFEHSVAITENGPEVLTAS
ncbi:type I methionyl aminopeptidase [Patescibacteria group bacterium]|nr:type I methionyl aminopeptidase [Patescibacteria group bacterium]